MPDDDIYYEPVGMDEIPVVQTTEPDVEPPVEEPVEEPPTDEPVVDPATSFERRIIAVQCRLKAPKNQYNAFGKYSYRNCEDILEALKPLLEENDLLMTTNYDVVFIQGRFYIKATVTVRDVISGLSRSVSAYAREPENKKGSDQSQVTGSCSSYAHKYALSAMWLIDDNKDPDVPIPMPQKEPPANGPFVAHCKSCGTAYEFASAEQYQQFITNPGCCPNPHWEVS